MADQYSIYLNGQYVTGPLDHDEHYHSTPAITGGPQMPGPKCRFSYGRICPHGWEVRRIVISFPAGGASPVQQPKVST